MLNFFACRDSVTLYTSVYVINTNNLFVNIWLLRRVELHNTCKKTQVEWLNLHRNALSLYIRNKSQQTCGNTSFMYISINTYALWRSSLLNTEPTVWRFLK